MKITGFARFLLFVSLSLVTATLTYQLANAPPITSFLLMLISPPSEPAASMMMAVSSPRAELPPAAAEPSVGPSPRF